MAPKTDGRREASGNIGRLSTNHIDHSLTIQGLQPTIEGQAEKVEVMEVTYLGNAFLDASTLMHSTTTSTGGS